METVELWKLSQIWKYRQKSRGDHHHQTQIKTKNNLTVSLLALTCYSENSSINKVYWLIDPHDFILISVYLNSASSVWASLELINHLSSLKKGNQNWGSLDIWAYRGGSSGRLQGGCTPSPPEMKLSSSFICIPFQFFSISLSVMSFLRGVPPPKKNPGSAPGL